MRHLGWVETMWDETFRRKVEVAGEVRDWLEARIKELGAQYFDSNKVEEGELDYWVQITGERYAHLSDAARQIADQTNLLLDQVK